MESNPETSVYGVFCRRIGWDDEWQFYGTWNRRKSSLYSKESTAKSIASRENNYQERTSGPALYEYKVMKLTGEWSDIG